MMAPAPSVAGAQGRAAGSVWQGVLHGFLLALIAGQVLYLAGHFRVRVDLTANREYSLTPTTQKVLGGLAKELRIECYWSPVDGLAPVWIDARRELSNFLEELEATAGGRVSVRRYDPSKDERARSRAVRLQLKPMPAGVSQGVDAASSRLVWQGIRMLYGADQQVVVDAVEPQSCSPRKLQALLVPRIQVLASGERPVIGFMEWSSPPGNPARSRRRTGLAGWKSLRTQGDLADRYRWVDCRTESGGFIPDEVRMLVLFSPRRLDDRTKFTIDQFLMRGGQLLVYSDLFDYFLGAERSFDRRAQGGLDLPDSVMPWVDQLASYGIRLQNSIVGERDTRSLIALGNPLNQAPWFSPVEFPYGFRAVGRDWKSQAGLAARVNGIEDPELKDRMEELLLPGLATDHPVLSRFAGKDSGPTFLWPHAVRLADPLPDGIVGKELARTSALGLQHRPPDENIDAPGSGRSVQQRTKRRELFRARLRLYLDVLPSQVPVMAEVAGRFRSAFAGKRLPAGLVASKDPRGGSDEGAVDGSQDEGGDPAAIGPTLPQRSEAAGGGEVVDFVQQATASGRIVVVGDSVALRDDVRGGYYDRLGGPFSKEVQGSYLLFTGLVDWLTGAEDLLELRVRDLTDRRIGLVEREAGQSRVAWQLQVRRRENLLAAVAIGLPTSLLIGLGFVMGARRRQARRRHTPVAVNPGAGQGHPVDSQQSEKQP